jgi:uncharacterized protein YjbI with pentapeptide repeats
LKLSIFWVYDRPPIAEVTAMQQEIDRVLEMVRDGTLTPEQAKEMIAALNAAGGEAEPRRRQRRRHRHRSRDFDRALDNIGDDIERALGAGARTLRWALHEGLHLKSAAWGDESNSVVLSRADVPTGSEFVCENNQLAVSQLKRLKLVRATFSDNELNAASIEDLELNESRVTGQRLRGSSIKGGLLEHSEVTGNELNGARLVNLTASRGRLIGCHFNGSQVRDLGIADSALQECRCNGTKLKTVVMRGDSLIKNLRLNGVLGRDWLFEAAILSDVQVSGLRVDGLVIRRGGLEAVTFKTARWRDRRDDEELPLMRGVELSRVILKNCTFVDCRFDGTRLEGFEASDLEFDGIDFADRVIGSAAELRELGRARDVA